MDYRFKESRISVSSTMSSDRSAGAASSCAFILLYALTTMNMTKPTMTKLINAPMNAPTLPAGIRVSPQTVETSTMRRCHVRDT